MDEIYVDNDYVNWHHSVDEWWPFTTLSCLIQFYGGHNLPGHWSCEVEFSIVHVWMGCGVSIQEFAQHCWSSLAGKDSTWLSENQQWSLATPLPARWSYMYAFDFRHLHVYYWTADIHLVTLYLILNFGLGFWLLQECIGAITQS